jgi:hypothetical protein
MSFFDDDASPLTVTAPYWMKPRADGTLNAAPKKFDRVSKADALKAAETVTAQVASMAAAQRVDNATVARASTLGQSVSPQMYVAPATVTVGDLFSVTYYGTWKTVTNLVSGEVGGIPCIGGAERRAAVRAPFGTYACRPHAVWIDQSKAVHSL